MFTENLNRTVAKFDAQFTLSEYKQQQFSSALASLETVHTKFSKSIDGEIYLLIESFYFIDFLKSLRINIMSNEIIFVEYQITIFTGTCP